MTIGQGVCPFSLIDGQLGSQTYFHPCCWFPRLCSIVYLKKVALSTLKEYCEIVSVRVKAYLYLIHNIMYTFVFIFSHLGYDSTYRGSNVVVKTQIWDFWGPLSLEFPLVCLPNKPQHWRENWLIDFHRIRIKNNKLSSMPWPIWTKRLFEQFCKSIRFFAKKLPKKLFSINICSIYSSIIISEKHLLLIQIYYFSI